MEKRIISTEILTEDAKIENSLRPLKLDDYVGQEKVKRNLKVYIKGSKGERRFTRPCLILWTSWTW